jgi:hypothetical protein
VSASRDGTPGWLRGNGQGGGLQLTVGGRGGTTNSEPDLAGGRELMSTPLTLVLVMKHIDQLLHKTLH